MPCSLVLSAYYDAMTKEKVDIGNGWAIPAFSFFNLKRTLLKMERCARDV